MTTPTFIRANAVSTIRNTNAVGVITSIIYTTIGGLTQVDLYPYGLGFIPPAGFVFPSATPPATSTGGSNVFVTPNARTISEQLFIDGSYPRLSTQTVNATGQVTTVNYNFNDGSRTQATFEYATPTSVDYLNATYTTLPSLVVLPVVPGSGVVSGFTISVDGRFLNYISTGGTLTSFTGTLNLPGDPRALTFVSDVSARISGNPINRLATGVTVTVTSSTPAMTIPVTNAAVVNNSTAMVQVPLNFSGFTGVAQSVDTVTVGAVGQGAVATQAINATLPFEVISYGGNPNAGGGLVVCIESENSATFGWVSTNTYLLGAYTAPTNGEVFRTTVGGSGVLVAGRAAPIYTKLAKSGSDLVLSTSPDGLVWSVDFTQVGVLTGLTTAYVKTFLASSSTGAKSTSIQLFT